MLIDAFQVDIAANQHDMLETTSKQIKTLRQNEENMVVMYDHMQVRD